MTKPVEELPCPHCEKPTQLCICEGIKPIDNKVFVLVLRHPQEKDEKLGTARLVTLQLKNSLMKTGLSWPNLTKILGRPIDPKRWGVLYLGTAKNAQPLPQQILTVVSRKGSPVEDQSTILKHMEGIILLDGNWSQAKALWWRNAWLLKCPRLVLQPPRPSLYGQLRKEPRRESVATIEAAAFTLATLEKTQDLADKILEPFNLLLTKVKAEKTPK
jgi:DTW domain-containing protein YfiP